MRLADVVRVLSAQVLSGEAMLDREIETGVASDLVSDALAYTGPNMLLITGLTNPQVIRTAELIDGCGILFVRGKLPADTAIITMAQDKNIPIISTGRSMFETCALLHAAGLKGARARDGQQR